MPATHLPGLSRRQPKQRRARQTVEAILDAVVRILKREGAKAVNTNRIAEVAGVSIGSLYQYFPDKSAIFMALHRRHVEEIDRMVEKTLVQNASASLDELMRAMIEAMIDAHRQDPQLYEALLAEVPQRAEETKDFSTRFHGAFRLAIAARIPELRSVADLDKTVFVVTHLVDALSHGVILRRPAGLALAAAKQEALRAVLSYLRAARPQRLKAR